MFVKFVVLLSSALFASGSFIDFEPKPMLDGRIVGGFQVDITQVPWQASLQRSGRHFCGASIIGEKCILTAAHCTQAVNQSPVGLTVRIGSTKKSSGGRVHKVKNIYQNEMYNGFSIDWDYSLLELEDTIEFNDKAQPITLVDANRKISDSTKCLVTGWGNTQSTDSSELLRGAEIPIVNQQKCASVYKRFMRGITPRMMCAGLEEGGKDSCQGDSGGPLVTYDESTQTVVQIGVVSWGYGCAQPTYPGVCARLTAGRDWIYENTGI